MSEEALPSLSEEQIQYVSMPANYKRGVRHYLSDAMTNLVRQGSELWAEYKWKGIGDCAYQIHATLGGGDGIESSSCTCPYGREAKEYDLCAHQIAMLYRYVCDPLAFHVIPSLAKMLASHSRDELFALIGQMVQNQPKLLLSVELAHAQMLSPQPIDTSASQLQPQRTLREHDNSQTALEQQQKMFWTSPCLEGYEALQDVAQQAGSWRKVRNSVLSSLEYRQHFGVLIELALHENNVEQALELLPRLTAKSQPCYRLSIVPLIERTQQQAAIAFHEKVVEALISQRKRDKYKFAVKHLQRMKERYGLLQAQSDWETYFQQLRSQYPNLRALQEELNEAKL